MLFKRRALVNCISYFLWKVLLVEVPAGTHDKLNFLWGLDRFRVLFGVILEVARKQYILKFVSVKLFKDASFNLGM